MSINARPDPQPLPRDFWVFGYGSLMWAPGFPYAARRPARLFGYRRALCVLSFVYRGTPDQPGLVFGLDAGGSCLGRVFQVRPRRSQRVYDYLMAREMVRGAYRPLWLPVATPQGRVSALCFVADRGHEQYAPDLSEAQIIERVRRAQGARGPNIDYIVNTCGHLETLGIRPRNLIRIRDALLGAPARDRQPPGA